MDWTDEMEAMLRANLKKRWHRVMRLIEQGYDEGDIIQTVRIRLWQAAQRYNPDVGYPLDKWLSYKTDFTLRDFERGRYD